MATDNPEPRFQLYYWPLPFRGCFVSYLFAWRDVPLQQVSDFDEINERIGQAPNEQDVPFIGPPVLVDLQAGQALSQMPAIVLHVADELDLRPDDPFELAMSMKILMDCNDVLMEICRYNGTLMWERDAWVRFRGSRLPRWFAVFEESLSRAYLGGDRVSFADIAVYALFGNMTRCLPELEGDLAKHAPGIHALCREIGAKPSLAEHVAEDERRYGKLYCGGYIEESIRSMLAADADGRIDL